MQKSKQILSIMTSGVVVVTSGYALMKYNKSNQFRRSEKISSNEVRSDQDERSQSANETSHLSINPQETNEKTNKKTKSHELKDASSTSINLSQLNSIESSNDLNATESVEDPTSSSLKNDKSLKTSDDSLEQSAKSEKTIEKTKSERSIEPNLVQSVVSAKGESLVQPELPEAIVTEKGKSLVQPELPEAIATEKGESLVQPELPEATVTEKGESLVQPELPEATVTAKGESLVQPELPEAIVTEKGESLVQPELLEAIATEKGESLVQPELPEYTQPISAKGESIVQSELPEYTHSISTKGESLVQPENEELIVYEKGESLVQPELPEAIVTEKGESLVQPNLPEYAQPISIKGESLVQPELPEFTLIKTIKTKTETIRPPYVRMPDMKLPEGEKRDSFPGVEGKVEKEVEEYTSLDGKVYLTKVLSEKRTDPIVRVERYGTMKAGEQPGKVGVNDAYEHFPNADFAEMNIDVKLTAEEIRSLSKEEIYSRAKGQYSNTINEVGKPGFYTVRIAPVADKAIDGLNSGTYLDHNLLSEEMLRLVNEERVRIGRQPLKWSNALYNFAKVRSAELASNGHIRFFNDKNEAMPHTRDGAGKKWYTIFANTKYTNDTAGENTAGYAMSRNVYSMFSEKFIAEELFEQWKNSRGHYENMISEDYKYFGFSVQFSKFWRFDKAKIDYFFKGAQGVQLFGGDSFKD